MKDKLIENAAKSMAIRSGWAGWDSAKDFTQTLSGNDPEEEREGWRDLARIAFNAFEESHPKDHIMARVVNNLRDVAIQFHDTQQLRSRIQDAIAPLLEKPDES